ncbi:hypothetical protein LAV45_18850, partial [Clostridium sporogenes]|nr:hypothetical protein [Clostridium sporogenes]
VKNGLPPYGKLNWCKDGQNPNSIKNNSSNKPHKNEVDKNIKKEPPSENKNGKPIKDKPGNQK